MRDNEVLIHSDLDLENFKSSRGKAKLFCFTVKWGILKFYLNFFSCLKVMSN